MFFILSCISFTLFIINPKLSSIEEFSFAALFLKSLKVFFKDGTHFTCGPTILTLGVNFTLIDDEWNIEYIFEASSMENLQFGTNSVTIQFTQEIPSADDDHIDTNTPYVEERMIILPATAIPVILGVIIIGMIVVTGRQQRMNGE